MTRHPKLVVDELLTKPSAVSPTLFVGLGGCGCRMVDRVAQHLGRRHDYRERFKNLVKFALIDTNVNDLESYRDRADAIFLLSDFEKEQYANLASGKMFLEADPYFTQWVPQNYRFRAGDTAGAGQIRIESRLGLFYQIKHKDFIPRFRALLEELKSHEHGHRRLDSPEIRIILCYSIAGGTGSGCHLPLAYVLRDLASDLGKPFLIGVTVLPAVFEDKTRVNKDGTFANAYAALKETEQLMKLGAPDSRFFKDEGVPFHYNPAEESKRVVRQRPFEFLYLIDKPESFSVPEPVDAAADGLYLQFFSPLFGMQASDYDNYTQHQRFLVPHDFESKGIIGFTSFYGSYGAAVLLVPAGGLIEYCSQAAALSLIRSSFLRDIPGDPTYQTLQLNRDPFDEVTLEDKKNERPIHRSDFGKQELRNRNRLRDRLYMKRVRLLAACELREGRTDGRYFAIFRHGHRLGERPKVDGSYEYSADQVEADHKQLADGRMAFSINALLLEAVAGERPNQPLGLLQASRQAIEAYAEENRQQLLTDTDVGSLRSMASGWMEDYRRVGLRVLKNGYSKGTLRYPGMGSLVELDFLRQEAGEVDLAAKRYAVLNLLAQIEWDRRPPEPITDFELGDVKDSDRVKAREPGTILQQLEEQAIDRAMVGVFQAFLAQLSDLKENLERFAGVQRVLEEGSDRLEEEQVRRLVRLRDEGDPSANQYILDAEALQTEDGRRMWDFYYEDRVANLPELSLQNRRVQQVLSDTVTDLSVSGGAGISTTAVLDKLYTALRLYGREVLKPLIAGDPHSADRERHDGLTLAEALELEVVYRALYRSNREEVEARGHQAVRDIVSRYRALPDELKEKLTEPKHRDYLRDKVKRVVKEKASLLCVYDDARDQHGGVRPDHVFLAAIDERFKNTPIDEALRGADIANLHWVENGWHNPKEIIFYRSILNVPLYVFGRMDVMKHDYYRFKGLAKRSKVLHIDKNWEESLPDLDPDSAKENHRQKLVREQIINFAALLTIHHATGSGRPYIVRRESKYYLTDPQPHAANDGMDEGGGLAYLGENLTEAIQRLPEVLDAEKVKYRPYQQVLYGVRQGLSPSVLQEIVRLPFRWRQNRDELRTQYGANPTPFQVEKIDDYTTSYSRLKESLDDLLEKLRNREIEHRTLGEELPLHFVDEDSLPSREPARSLVQSILILRSFSEAWRQMENPEESAEIPQTFRKLFIPLKEDELDSALEALRSSLSPTNGRSTSPPEAPSLQTSGPRAPRSGKGRASASPDGQ